MLLLQPARLELNIARYVQCPTWGWPTEGAYYRDASSVDAVYDIRIPVLAIHAEDDPVNLPYSFNSESANKEADRL